MGNSYGCRMEGGQLGRGLGGNKGQAPAYLFFQKKKKKKKPELAGLPWVPPEANLKKQI